MGLHRRLVFLCLHIQVSHCTHCAFPEAVLRLRSFRHARFLESEFGARCLGRIARRSRIPNVHVFEHYRKDLAFI